MAVSTRKSSASKLGSNKMKSPRLAPGLSHAHTPNCIGRDHATTEVRGGIAVRSQEGRNVDLAVFQAQGEQITRVEIRDGLWNGLNADSLGVVYRELMSRLVVEDSHQRNARLGCCV